MILLWFDYLMVSPPSPCSLLLPLSPLPPLPPLVFSLFSAVSCRSRVLSVCLLARPPLDVLRVHPGPLWGGDMGRGRLSRTCTCNRTFVTISGASDFFVLLFDFSFTVAIWLKSKGQGGV